MRERVAGGMGLSDASTTGEEDDATRQKAIIDVTKLFDQPRAAKEYLRKAYAECKDIPQEKRAVIDNFLEDEGLRGAQEYRRVHFEGKSDNNMGSDIGLLPLRGTSVPLTFVGGTFMLSLSPLHSRGVSTHSPAYRCVKALRTRLVMSTAYHPQTDGQSERTIQMLEDMLRVVGKGKARSSKRLLKELCGLTPWKGVVHFRKKGKLASRYVGPFEILERIGLVAYRLRLSKELSGVHDMFHVSNLKKCLADASLHVPLDEIKVDKTLRFVEEPVEIMDREIKSLKRSKISLVKVRWNSKRGPEFTWEREDYMKSKYPQLFVDRADESAS
ncbi:putative reverse transcriptase domain-containing protein [Tanacetum coccineum]